MDANGQQLRYASVPLRVEGDPAHGVFLVAVDLGAEREALARARTSQTFTLLGTVLLIALTAGLALTRLLRPLRTLSSTASRISEEDLSQRIPEEGADDIAELTRTVNGMLARLDDAFQAQRNLLDDVGHELRTPLTVIRGHLEVLDSEDSDDVTETRTLVMDEIDRMTRLVEELVLLARSMRPDFLSVREVDVDVLLHGFFERATVLGERRWRLDTTTGGVVVMADPERLLQAGLQLAANAVRHTGPDDQIGIGAAATDTVLRLWVRDTGDGIAEVDQRKIFERTVRGEALGRDRLSSGLGLSIVSAIATAHGGRVDLISTLGAGSTFTLELPLPVRETELVL